MYRTSRRDRQWSGETGNGLTRPFERLTLHVVVGPPSLFVAVHQPGITEDVQVVGNGRLPQGEDLHKLEHADLSLVPAEQAQDAQPMRVGQSLEQASLRIRILLGQRRNETGTLRLGVLLGRCGKTLLARTEDGNAFHEAGKRFLIVFHPALHLRTVSLTHPCRALPEHVQRDVRSRNGYPLVQALQTLVKSREQCLLFGGSCLALSLERLLCLEKHANERGKILVGSNRVMTEVVCRYHE